MLRATTSLSIRRAAFFSVPIALFVAFFYQSFLPGSRFIYRDVAFYYYPLFQQIQHEWECGRIPLWNPYANLGQPLIGDPTASVFYPLKLVFFLASLKILSFSTCFKIYIWTHIVIAWINSYRLARRLSVSPIGSLFSSTTYAFSGQILFQYSNVIYLVGSAWAPLLFSLAFDFYQRESISLKLNAVLKLGIIQAITILGGEPQIVYLSLVTVSVIFLFSPVKLVLAKKRQDRALKDSIRCEKVFDNRLNRILIMIVFFFLSFFVAFSLSAIQVLPSFESEKRSNRVTSTEFSSIWSIPFSYYKMRSNDEPDHNNFQENIKNEFLCGDFSAKSTNATIYRFSVGPWRLLEFLFPNIGGRQFPQYSRWFGIFPEEVSVWVPTLYFGVFPFLLAISAFKLRRSQSKRNQYQRIATIVTCLFLVAALGGYGLVWFIRLIVAVATHSHFNAAFTNYDPVGGIYWLFNVTLPKFNNFRYPAKMLTIASIGFSFLVGAGWDCRRQSSLLPKLAITLGCVSLTLSLLIALYGYEYILKTIRLSDPLFGPFQNDLAYKNLLRAPIQSTTFIFVQTFFVFISRFKPIKKNRAYRIGSIYFVFILTALDIYLANSWIIVTAPQSTYRNGSDVEKYVETNQKTLLAKLQPKVVSSEYKEESFNAVPPVRIYRFPVWFPPLFTEQTSPQRNIERVIWDVETLFPQYPTQYNIASIDSRGAYSERNYERFVNELLNKRKANNELAFLDVQYAIGPRFWLNNLLEPTANRSSSETKGNDFSRLDFSFSTIKLEGNDARAAIVKSAGKEPNNLFTTSSHTDEFVEILAWEPNSIIYLFSLQRDSDIIFAEQFWPDWKITITPIRSEDETQLVGERFNARSIKTILKRLEKENGSIEKSTRDAFGFLRKTDAPQGLWIARVQYKPKLFLLGLIISASAWILLSTRYLLIKIRSRKFK